MPKTDTVFRLSDEFIANYADRKPPFGFNGLGELVYLRTYSRIKEDGTQEQWYETVRRVVEGTYTMQKRWITEHNLGWSERKAQRSAQEMYDRIWNMKFLPPGRGLWAMGSPLTEEKGLFAALNNCAFVSTANLDKDLADPFTFLMDASMLGIGVGFDTKGAGKLTIGAPQAEQKIVAIPDTREGWVESVKLLLESYFEPNSATVIFDYSQIRPAGTPIKGFGGVASGPAPLQQLHEDIRRVLDAAVGQPISVTNIVDIQNLIGKCVVAGNVRRCLPKGTLVHTSEGLIPIEAIRPGMLAKTADGYSPISELVPQGVQSVWAVDTQLGEFRATAKHRVAVMDGIGTYQWKRLNELVAGDRLVFVDSVTDGIETSLPAWEYAIPKHSTTCVDITIPRLDAEMGWLLGLLHGDGYVYANREEGGFNAYVSVACAAERPDIIEATQRQLARFGTHVTTDTRSEEQCVVVRTQSKQLAWYLDEHFKRPNTTIRVPSWILQAPADVRAAYVAGVFDADGSQQRPLVAASSVYPEFLQDLQAVLASLGIPARLRLHRPAKGSWKDLWHLNVVGEVSLDRWDALVAPYAHKYVPVEGRRRSGHDYGFPAEWVKSAGIDYGRSWSVGNKQMTVATAVRFGADTAALIPVEVLGVRPDVAVVETYDIAVPGPQEFVAQGGLLVHNTAEIAFGEPTDEEFIDLKNYEKNPHRAEYGWTSNNSIFAELGMDYTAAAQRIKYNGEPGFAWLENMRAYSRMGDVPDHKDKRVMGANPCVEQSLESYELCCLVETFPANHESLEDYKRTLKFAYLYAKTVTLGKTPWARTNRVLLRNRRIGLSQSGIQQAIAKMGIEQYRQWCEKGYETVRYYDDVYSEWLAIPKSVKVTSVKPSGSVSLLAGATPGMHWPESTTYIRRMRLSKYSDLIAPLQEAGYKLEPAVGSEDSTRVVEIPVTINESIRTAAQVSMWEQLAMAAFLQRHWSDNQVSATITFNPETEGDQIAHALNYFQYSLKGISFLPRLDYGAYPQMPYEAISDEQYQEMVQQLKPLNFGATHEKAESEKFCDSSGCVI